MKININQLLLLFSASFVASLSYAETISCKPFKNNSAIINFSGDPVNLSIGEDAPIGSVFYRAEHVSPDVYGVLCTTSNNSTAKVKAVQLYELINTTNVIPGLTSEGAEVYKTNIPGVGLSFKVQNHNGLSYSPMPVTWSRDHADGGGTWVDISIRLVKTEQTIQEGLVDIGMYAPTFRASIIDVLDAPTGYVYDGKKVEMSTVQFTGSFQPKIISSSCNITVPDINLNLGSHNIQHFTGIGSTTNWVRGNIQLSNCNKFSPGFFGYKNTSASITGSGTMPIGTPDLLPAITFQVLPSVPQNNHNFDDLKNGQIEIDTGINAASGVKIQVGIKPPGSPEISPISLLERNPSKFGQPTTNTFEIPVYARYIQKENTITPGVAKGSVIYTVTYK